MADATLGPNDRQPCPSEARKVYHRAHGEECKPCGIDWSTNALPPVAREEVSGR